METDNQIDNIEKKVAKKSTFLDMLPLIILLIILYFVLLLFGGVEFIKSDTIKKDTINEIGKKLEEKNHLLFTDELKSRAAFIKEFDDNYLKIKSFIDSQKTNIGKLLIIKYLLPKNPIVNKISIKDLDFDHNDEFLRNYQSLYVNYRLNTDKIESFLEKGDITQTRVDDILRSADCIIISKDYDYEISRTAFILFNSIFAVAFLILYFLFRNNSPLKKIFEHFLALTEVNNLKKELRNMESEVAGTNLKDNEKLKKLLKNKINEAQAIIDVIKTKEELNFVFVNTLNKTKQDSKNLYNRATLMLVSGLIMSFVGISIFYLSLPNYSLTSLDLYHILYFSLRPTLILLFIEGISWFLLRQYRLLIEDYKFFHKIYLRKLNYYTTYRLMQGSVTNKSEVELILLQALLNENFNYNLQKDESTEGLEYLKLDINKNSISEIVTGLLKKASQDKD